MLACRVYIILVFHFMRRKIGESIVWSILVVKQDAFVLLLFPRSPVFFQLALLKRHSAASETLDAD